MTTLSHPVLSTLEGFFLRWIAAAALVIGTYNPSRLCYIEWMLHADKEQLPYLIFIGILILLGFAVFLRATKHSIGLFGAFLLITLLGSGVWSMAHLGLLDLYNHNVLLYGVELVLATVMAVGLDWSVIRRKLSGQIDVEER